VARDFGKSFIGFRTAEPFSIGIGYEPLWA
jgi:hypothetical protein